MNHYLSREVKYGPQNNKLDEYVDRRRAEIYARMKMPIVLENHYSAATDISNASIKDEISHSIFDYSNTTGSKLLFLSDSKTWWISNADKSQSSSNLFCFN